MKGKTVMMICRKWWACKLIRLPRKVLRTKTFPIVLHGTDVFQNKITRLHTSDGHKQTHNIDYNIKVKALNNKYANI